LDQRTLSPASYWGRPEIMFGCPIRVRPSA
jgi:hypothetical protein